MDNVQKINHCISASINRKPVSNGEDFPAPLDFFISMLYFICNTQREKHAVVIDACCHTSLITNPVC
jgi:hypothetical protein